MLKKKICMLGSPSVGKTSLVRRYVESIFSEKYLATVGVKIDQKLLNVEDQPVTLMLWDMEGINLTQRFQTAYLSGAAGYILVADGTRPHTVEEAVRVQEYIASVLGPVPFLLAINKHDLADAWEMAPDKIAALTGGEWHTVLTSAKSGEGVEEAFAFLAGKLLAD